MKFETLGDRTQVAFQEIIMLNLKVIDLSHLLKIILMDFSFLTKSQRSFHLHLNSVTLLATLHSSITPLLLNTHTQSFNISIPLSPYESEI